MEPLRAFLDANVLFSAALGGRSFELLWSLAASQRTTLFTSRMCVVEAETNLQRKRRDRLGDFQLRMRSVHVVADAEQAIAGVDLPEKDAPIYASAVAMGADVFISGDLRHFGDLMHRSDIPVRVRTVRVFLLEGLE